MKLIVSTLVLIMMALGSTQAMDSDDDSYDLDDIEHSPISTIDLTKAVITKSQGENITIFEALLTEGNQIIVWQNRVLLKPGTTCEKQSSLQEINGATVINPRLVQYPKKFNASAQEALKYSGEHLFTSTKGLQLSKNLESLQAQKLFDECSDLHTTQVGKTTLLQTTQ